MRTIDVTRLKGVNFTGGKSFRPIVSSDKMGFGVCKTVIPKGLPHKWHYPNHLEACYCIKGSGELTCLETGHKFEIKPDVIYIQDDNKPHTFQAFEDVVLISIFNPPLNGDEKHDENGKY